jgi:hypothetical protein
MKIKVRHKKRSTVIILVLVVLLLIPAILYMSLRKKPMIEDRKGPVKVAQTAKIPPQGELEEPEDSSFEIERKWYGLCQKNIVHSVEDFKNVVQNDPVLSQYFSDFNWDNAKMGNLPETLFTSVAFRNNDTINKTRKKIRLPKGDGYITDGKRWARSYCCNEIFDAPVPEGNKPTEEAEAPVPAGNGTVAVTKSPPPPPIPEPGTLVLVGTGMAGFGLRRWLRKKQD